MSGMSVHSCDCKLQTAPPPHTYTHTHPNHPNPHPPPPPPHTHTHPNPRPTRSPSPSFHEPTPPNSWNTSHFLAEGARPFVFDHGDILLVFLEHPVDQLADFAFQAAAAELHYRLEGRVPAHGGTVYYARITFPMQGYQLPLPDKHLDVVLTFSSRVEYAKFFLDKSPY